MNIIYIELVTMYSCFLIQFILLHVMVVHVQKKVTDHLINNFYYIAKVQLPVNFNEDVTK